MELDCESHPVMDNGSHGTAGKLMLFISPRVYALYYIGLGGSMALAHLHVFWIGVHY